MHMCTVAAAEPTYDSVSTGYTVGCPQIPAHSVAIHSVQLYCFQAVVYYCGGANHYRPGAACACAICAQARAKLQCDVLCHIFKQHSRLAPVAVAGGIAGE